MTGQFIVEALGPAHNRDKFTCGVEPLDRYFRQQVSQDIRRRLSNCFVAVDSSGAVAGYYTFSATSLPMTDLSAGEAKRLPRYPLLPAGLIGRLAVGIGYTGRGLGAALLLDVVARATRAAPAIFALVVDAKDDHARGFYEHLGFQSLTRRPASLYWLVAEAARRLSAG